MGNQVTIDYPLENYDISSFIILPQITLTKKVGLNRGIYTTPLVVTNYTTPEDQVFKREINKRNNLCPSRYYAFSPLFELQHDCPVIIFKMFKFFLILFFEFKDFYYLSERNLWKSCYFSSFIFFIISNWDHFW